MAALPLVASDLGVTCYEDALWRLLVSYLSIRTPMQPYYVYDIYLLQIRGSK